MARTLCYYGNPVLRKKAEKVTEITSEIHAIIEDMKTAVLSSESGIGLGAPQVGALVAIIVVFFPDPAYTDKYTRLPPQVFINPELKNPSSTSKIEQEASLSIPGVFGNVERPVSIDVTARNLDGTVTTETFIDFHARLIMHEND